MAVLSSEERDQVEMLLLKERDRIVRRLRRREEWFEDTAPGSGGDTSPFSYHLADQGTDAMEREKAFLMAGEEGRVLRQIDDALRRLYDDPDRFGECERCREGIPVARLDAIPYTRLCVDCKNLEESA